MLNLCHLLVAIASTGFAQDKADSHGLHVIPGNGAGDLITTWQPQQLEAGDWAVSGTYEYAEWSLLPWLRGEDGAPEPLVDQLNALHLGGAYAVHERVGIGLSAPVWVVPVFPDGSTTPGLGDVRLSVPLGVVVPGERRMGWGVSLVPHLQLPSGDEEVGLGASSVRTGAALAFGHGQDEWNLAMNLGINSGFDDATGPRVGGGVGGTYRWSEALSLGAELTTTHPVNETAGVTSTEALFSGSGGLTPRLDWTVGAARTLSGGSFSPLHRLFAGVVLKPAPATPAPAPPVVHKGTVRVITRTIDGQPVDSQVRFMGDQVHPPQNLGPDGRAEYALNAGMWRIVITAPSLGRTVQEIELESGRSDVYIIEVILQPSKVEVTDTEIEIKEKVHFAFDQDTVETVSVGLLKEVAATLLAEQWIEKVEVQGHTDSSGKPDYNLQLSQRRVEAVRAALIGFGVPASRLVAKGYGETQPIASNDDDAGRAQNRRVQFIIIQTAE